MKKLLIFVLLLIVASSVVAETKLKMEIWNRWTYKMVDGDLTQNELAVKRGYFRLEPKFGANIKGRFNLDFFSDDGADDGVGIKMKYAYLDFSNFLPIKDAKLTVGLMKTYFGTIYEYEYTVIEKDPSDKYKFVSSTDYGFGVSGYLPSGLGTYNVAVYNGEGYKKSGGDLNKDLNYAADIRVIPVVGLTLGGSYMFQSKNDAEVDDEDNPERVEYNMMAGIANFAYGPAKIYAQYLNKVTSHPNVDGADDVTSTVISVMPTFKVNDKIDVVGRYDMYDPNTDTDDDGNSTMIFGFNYHIMKDSKNNPKLFVQTNYEMTTYEAEDSDDVTQLLVQLRWIFSETMK